MKRVYRLYVEEGLMMRRKKRKRHARTSDRTAADGTQPGVGDGLHRRRSGQRGGWCAS